MQGNAPPGCVPSFPFMPTSALHTPTSPPVIPLPGKGTPELTKEAAEKAAHVVAEVHAASAATVALHDQRVTDFVT